MFGDGYIETYSILLKTVILDKPLNHLAEQFASIFMKRFTRKKKSEHICKSNGDKVSVMPLPYFTKLSSIDH